LIISGNLDTTDSRALTLLTTLADNGPDGKRGAPLLACKRYRADGGVESYGRATFFRGEVVDVSTDKKLDALLQVLIHEHEKFVVIGGILPDVDRSRMLRRSSTRTDGTGTLYDVAREILILDIDDDSPTPPDLDLKDPAAVGDYIRNYLAACAFMQKFFGVGFDVASCVVLLTSSHGRKPGVHARLFFRMSRPLTAARQKQLMKLLRGKRLRRVGTKDIYEHNFIDPSPHHPIQANYTSEPVFDDPSADPCVMGRLARLPGRAFIEPPSDEQLDAATSAEVNAQRDRQVALAQLKRLAKATTKTPKTPKPERSPKVGRPAKAPKPGHDDDDDFALIADLFAELIDDADAVAAAKGYLLNYAPIAVEGQRHTTAIQVAHRCGDLGCSLDMATKLMEEHWLPRGDDFDLPLADELAGLFDGRETPLGVAHPRANEIIARLQGALPFDLGDYIVKPEDDAPEVELNFDTLEAGEERLRGAIETAIERATEEALTHPNDTPSVIGIRAELGIGKTRLSRHALRRALTTLRAASNGRPIFFATPTHDLGGEVAARFIAEVKEALGDLTCVVWRGREAENPDRPGERMCRNHIEAKAAQEVCKDVATKICPTCPHRDGCAYLAQFSADFHGDLWVGAHAMLFNAPPEPLRRQGGPALVVIDEGIDQTPLIGIDPENLLLLPIELLREGGMRLPEARTEFPRVHDTLMRELKQAASAANRAFLSAIRDRLRDFLDNAKRGPVSREALLAAGFNVSAMRRALRAEKSRTYYGKGDGDYEDNRTLRPAMAMWAALADLLKADGPEASGRISIVAVGKDKARAVRMTGYAEIAEGFRRPTVLLDAMLDVERAKHVFSNITVDESPRIDMPHVTIKRSVGYKFSKKQLEPLKRKRLKKGEKLPPGLIAAFNAENQRRAEIRRSTRSFIINTVRREGGETLVVGNKRAIKAMRLPPHILPAHFNAIAGRDEWAHVRRIFIVGGTLPKPIELEDVAGAMTGREPQRTPIDKRTGRKCWYGQEAAAHIVRRGGRFVNWRDDETFSFVHEDELVQRLLQRTLIGEIMQAIGRGRGIRRTADNPLEIIILNDVVMPELPVDELFYASLVFRTTPEDEQFAAGGVCFESPADMSRAYPKLWRTADAARKAMERSGVTLPSSQPELTARYRRKGPGHRPGVCRIDPAMTADPKAKITALLGELEEFEIMNGREAAPASVWERQLAAGGIAFLNAADATRFYPGMWKAGRTARREIAKALEVWPASGHRLNKEDYIDKALSGSWPHLCQFSYRLRGAGQRVSRCIVDSARISDPKAELQRVLGPLASFKSSNTPAPHKPDKLDMTVGEATLAPNEEDMSTLPLALRQHHLCLVPTFNWIEGSYRCGRDGRLGFMVGTPVGPIRESVE
jgi:putative DNA primase/helicase